MVAKLIFQDHRDLNEHLFTIDGQFWDLSGPDKNFNIFHDFSGPAGTLLHNKYIERVISLHSTLAGTLLS